MRTSVDLRGVGAVVEGDHGDPTRVLGAHPMELQGRKVTAVRAFLPDSEQVWILDPAHERSLPMRRIHPSGLYEAICPRADDEPPKRYKFRVAHDNGSVTTMYDPYSFASLLTDDDLYLFGEGNHARIYDRLGAHRRGVDGIQGVNFAVWAPNAVNISVIGDFNGWDGRRHPMQGRQSSGVWELFIPQLEDGEKYKYRLRTPWGQTIDKADPFAFAAELPPRTASIVAGLDNFAWSDDEWIEQRAARQALDQPLSIYEVHLGSWRRDPSRPHQWLGYRELAHQLVDYCRELGYTHLELLPVSEHPFTGSWGYQTVGYYAATSRYGSPEEFMYFVDHCHRHGIGVILDWVPAHFPRDAFGLARFDGTALYEHEDERQGAHPDWGTLIFNYGRNEVRNFLVANALFWLDKYHIDGLRVDAVASMLYLDYSRQEGGWIPNRHGGRENLEAIDLLQQFNEQCHARFPGVLTIAEESTAWGGVSKPTYDGGLGFSLKWNMGWMNDTLRYMRRDPIYRGHHHHEMTFSMVYAFSENFVLPFSHDEVVHGKGALIGQMPGDLWQKMANLRLLYAYQWTHPGKKLTFMGDELAQWCEWNHDESLQWDLLEWDTHRGMQRLVTDLNRLYREFPALHQLDLDGAGFEWIDCENAGESVLSYVRKGKDPSDFVLVACNFTPVVRHDYAMGVPRGGFYREILNSDSEYYGGSNVGNHPGLYACQAPWHGRSHSIRLTLPPLAAVVLQPV